MGLLAPLYFAGLAAIALPIVFHLIRRTPTGRQAFSSLMFLAPSPPRLTKRSRLTNILLLLLRAAALALLAFAFARPFLSSADDAAAPTARGRRVAILVDASASMRRGDLWKQAAEQAEQTLATLKPEDEAALYFFDRVVRPGLTFAEWNELAPAVRAPAFRARLAAAEPTWAGTRLGDALATAADLLTEDDDAKAANPAGPAAAATGSAIASGTPPPAARAGRQLVLISDLQQGGHAEALQGHPWPDGVLLQVRPVTPREPTNASVRWVEPRADESAARASSASPAAGGDDGSRLRVRVTNQPGATKEQFTLAWATDRGPVPGAEPLTVYVPAGRSQTVRVPWPAERVPAAAAAAAAAAASRPSASPDAPPMLAAAAPTPASPPVADRLLLCGDDADFDNALYVVPPRQDVVRVLYVGDDAAAEYDVNGLRFYLQGALADTPRRRVEFVARRPADPVADADWVGTRLAVVAAALADDRLVAAVRRFAEAGGDVLWVLPDAAAAGGLAKVVGVGGLTVAETPIRDHALIGRVDLDHPLFAPFAGGQYADFTKIHFWHHRRVTLPDATPASPAATGNAAAAAGGSNGAGRVLARFDDGDPFLLERPVGRGKVLIAASGWQPRDSQLALSSKFVPLVDGLVKRRDGSAVEAQQVVYEPVALPPSGVGGSAGSAGAGDRALLTPDGRRIALAARATATPPEATDRPGIYRLSAGGRETPLAVNLPPDEGRTAPLAVEEFERLGAKLGVVPSAEELVARKRQLRTAELENRQKLWRWVILVVLGLLAVETVVAGSLARRERRGPAAAAGGVPAAG